jgi:hypothetical protein
MRECIYDMDSCACMSDEVNKGLELFYSRCNMSTACPSGSELRVTVVTPGDTMCSCVKSFKNATISPDKHPRRSKELKRSIEEKAI